MFWEKRHRTQRLEVGNTSLAAQVRSVTEDQVMTNLNAILYEHLARQLQRNLAGDIALGRFAGGNVVAGDIFILCSEQFNCIVHIVEVGRDLVTFQLRGLEFTGTYCHSREAGVLHESINTGWKPDKNPTMARRERLKFKARIEKLFIPFPKMVKMRTLAYEFVTEPYVFRAYTIFDHSATSTLQVYGFRREFIFFYMLCIVYYASTLPGLRPRLRLLASVLQKNGFLPSNKNQNSPTKESSTSLEKPEEHSTILLAGSSASPIKLDAPVMRLDPFNGLNGLSFNTPPGGRSASMDSVSSIGCGTINKKQVVFWQDQKEYLTAMSSWIDFCRNRNEVQSQESRRKRLEEQEPNTPRSMGDDFASRLLFNDEEADFNLDRLHRQEVTTSESQCRKSSHSENGSVNPAEATQDKDQLLLTGLCFALCGLGRRLLLGEQTGPSALRIPIETFMLKLHDLFKGDARRTVLICPESDPRWRHAVLNDVSQLFSFRRLQDKDSSNLGRFRLITLKKCRVQLRVVKMNSECVRGFWAAQQREQIFLRSRNPERGSIQSAVPVLRNLIGSSADQPIGYPIYVSPLITSFTGDNLLHRFVMGSELRCCEAPQKNNEIVPTRAPLTSCCRSRCCNSTSNDSCYRQGRRSKSPPISTRATAGAENSSVLSTRSGPPDSPTGDVMLPDLLLPIPRPPVISAEVHEKQPKSQHDPLSPVVVHLRTESQTLGAGLVKRLVFPVTGWEKKVMPLQDLQALMSNQEVTEQHLQELRWTIRHRWQPCHAEIAQRSLCHRTLALITLAQQQGEISAPAQTLAKQFESRFLVVYETEALSTNLHHSL
ncbi:hypothetical protein Ciccas_000245 [Cichlidogyrus casuarinus]|uniref:Pecanex-like protein n=1 Tax=Cichlidogyrus casuarinus TaxID=1844966 RepID=A0ABD2QPL5_9PLAT